MNEIPRLVIAGTHSGCGKTTVAKGLMGALCRRGLEVQPFKVGPDFIDPTHHTLICGRRSRNLDPFMMGEEGVLDTFVRASRGADIAIIEGVMGLFDGIDGGDVASTAHVARILRAPVVLVVDAMGMSGSAHAVVNGFAAYDPTIQLAGVIYNRIGSERHRRMIERCRPHSAPPQLGCLPRRRSLEIPSRHLGLHLAGEMQPDSTAEEIVSEYCELDSLLEIAKMSAPLDLESFKEQVGVGERVRVGVALDSAFCFYYRDNLERLESAGAHLQYFSPLAGELPEVEAIYLGGGYPELHAASMVGSRFTERLKKVADDGMPVYAECGGLLVLCSTLHAEQEYRMSGILPAVARMTDRVQALDYVQARVIAEEGPLRTGIAFRGHEFHYSRVEPERDARYAIQLSRGKGITGEGCDGLVAQETLGCYTHAYFNQEFASSIVEAADRYSRS